jgi:hypothetical protein
VIQELKQQKKERVIMFRKNKWNIFLILAVVLNLFAFIDAKEEIDTDPASSWDEPDFVFDGNDEKVYPDEGDRLEDVL